MCVALILSKQIKKVDNPSTRTFFLIVKNVINSPKMLKTACKRLLQKKNGQFAFFEQSTSAIQMKLGQNVCCTESDQKNQKG